MPAISTVVQNKFDMAIEYLKSKYEPPPISTLIALSATPTSNHSYCHKALSAIVTNKLFTHVVNHIYNKNGDQQTIDMLLTGKNKVIWNNALSNNKDAWLKEMKTAYNTQIALNSYRTLRYQQIGR